jgi:Family of unknown function (DUF5990)
MAKSEVILEVTIETLPPSLYEGQQTEFGIQDKARNIEPPLKSSARKATFRVPIQVDVTGASVRYAGGFVHGPKADPFLYVGWRVTGGKDNNEWIEKGKVFLSGIPIELVQRAIKGDVSVIHGATTCGAWGQRLNRYGMRPEVVWQ